MQTLSGTQTHLAKIHPQNPTHLDITQSLTQSLDLSKNSQAPFSFTPGQTEQINISTFEPYSFSGCDGLLDARFSGEEEWVKDLFEHHALGQFLILHLVIANISNQNIQIWDGDYLLTAQLAGTEVKVSPHKAATNYLYITRGDSFYQDKIIPGSSWKTYLAFDVDPNISSWQLHIEPGAEIYQSLCEIRLP